MKKLKNWFVSFESVKGGKVGLVDYLSYLNNNNHINHKIGNKNDFHKIVKVMNNQNEFFLNLTNYIDSDYNLKKLNGEKVRQPRKYGQSVVISLPFQREEEELKLLSKEIFKEFYINSCKLKGLKPTNEGYKDFKNQSYINLHLTNKGGSKSQINIILPEHLNGVKVKFSELKYSHTMKIITELQVEKVLKVSQNDYILKEKEETTPKNFTTQQYKLNKEIEKYQELNEELQFMKNQLSKDIHLTELEKEMYEDKVKNVNGYGDRLKRDIERFEKETDIRKKEDLKRRLEKNYSKIIEGLGK